MNYQSYEKAAFSINQGVDNMGEIVDQINWECSMLYADCLAQIYYYVSHATRVLSFALSKTSVDDEELVTSREF